MAKIIPGISRTFSEYLLIPNLTSSECAPDNVSLVVPLVKYKKGKTPTLSLNIPMASAIMQSVSGEKMAIALAKQGGISFIYGSQSIENQANMVKSVKKYKSGFVSSDTNVKEDATLADVVALVEQTGHSTVTITSDGSPTGKLLGLLTDKDFRLDKDPLSDKASRHMTPVDKLVCGEDGISLAEANDLIWNHKLSCLPILDKKGNLRALVFRKDYDEAKNNPNSLVDKNQSYIVGAGVNTRDFAERIPALVKAGADVLCIDSSDGYSVYQKDVIAFVRKNYGDKVKIGAGNVVDSEGFLYLAQAGADFIKVGIGGGSICITREQKGIGRGQASALLDVVEARNEYFKDKGVYIPICSDGGIVQDYHITLALAMGADFVMMGRYFARFDESPTRIVKIGNNYLKEYWGEGSDRAKNWQRYDLGTTSKKLSFEEGVDSYIPYAGALKDNLDLALYKIRSTMCNCGAISVAELQKKARLTLVSEVSIKEGSAHDVTLREIDKTYK